MRPPVTVTPQETDEGFCRGCLGEVPKIPVGTLLLNPILPGDLENYSSSAVFRNQIALPNYF